MGMIEIFMRDQRSPRIPLNDKSSGIEGGSALTEMDGDTVANPLKKDTVSISV